MTSRFRTPTVTQCVQRGRKFHKGRKAEFAGTSFRATPKMWAYLEALKEALAARADISDRAMARRLSGRYQTYCEWRRRPEFCTWVNDQLFSGLEDMWPKILFRFASLAVQGSVDHATWLAKVQGKFLQSEGGLRASRSRSRCHDPTMTRRRSLGTCWHRRT